MGSPVYNALDGSVQPQSPIPQNQGFVNMFGQIRRSANPQAMFQQMAMQNPQIQQVMAYVNQCGGDPRAAFFNMAQQKGIDPNQILALLQHA